MAKIGEFVLDLFVDATKGELTVGNLIKSIGSLSVVSVGQIAILEALADRLVMVSQAAMHTAESLTHYASATGGSTEQLEKWPAAGRMVGATNEDVASSLTAITTGLTALKFGDNSPLLALTKPLNMSLKDLKDFKPEQLLEKIRNNPFFKAMSSAEQRYVLDKAGLGRMHRLLTNREGGISDKEFKQFARDAGSMSKGDRHDFEKMSRQFQTIEDLATRIGLVIAKWVSPATMEFLNKEIDALRVIAEYMEKTTPKGMKEMVKKFGKEQLAPTLLDFGAATGLIPDFGQRTEMINALTNPVFPGHPIAPNASMFNGPIQPSQKSTTIHQQNTIKVDGSKDPHVTAKTISDYLSAGVNLNLGNAVT